MENLTYQENIMLNTQIPGIENRIEAMLNLANSAIVSAERLAALNLNTGRPRL